MSDVIGERVKQVVLRVLKISEDAYHEELGAGDVAEWDSINHIKLIQEIETEFSINFQIMDVINIEDVADLIEVTERYVIVK